MTDIMKVMATNLAEHLRNASKFAGTALFTRVKLNLTKEEVDFCADCIEKELKNEQRKD